METTKVIILRLISSHNPDKPWKLHGFHMETTKVIVSRLISSQHLGKSLTEKMSFPHGNHVETVSACSQLASLLTVRYTFYHLCSYFYQYDFVWVHNKISILPQKILVILTNSIFLFLEHIHTFWCCQLLTSQMCSMVMNGGVHMTITF